MKISLLIDHNISSQILKIKTELYAKGVRMDKKTDVGIPHIKLAEALDPPINKQNEIIDRINIIFGKYKGSKIKNFVLVNDTRENSNWIALQIREKWLWDLSKEIENYLESKNINRTQEYKMNIYNIRKESNPEANMLVDECIADHLNLVNKCKKNMTGEAVERFSFLDKITEIQIGNLLFETQ